MIANSPFWQAVINPPFEVWPGEVWLLPQHVLGTWFCLDRASGCLLWQRSHYRMNTIAAVQDDIIVASETRWDSPLIEELGLYGLSLQTGEHLWTSHGSGRWGRFVRWLDWVPGFTNELRDALWKTRPGQVVTRQGRVLDIATGEEIGREIVDFENYETTMPAEWRLRKDKTVDFGEFGVLRKGTPDSPEQPDGAVHYSIFPLFCEDHRGHVRWVFEPSEQEVIDSYYGDVLFLPPFIYWVAAAEPLTAEGDTSTEPDYFTLQVLDIRSGQVVQRVPLNTQPALNARIHKGDEKHLLVSYLEAQAKTTCKVILCLERLHPT
jgi:hypothetical protein